MAVPELPPRLESRSTGSLLEPELVDY